MLVEQQGQRLALVGLPVEIGGQRPRGHTIEQEARRRGAEAQPARPPHQLATADLPRLVEIGQLFHLTFHLTPPMMID